MKYNYNIDFRDLKRIALVPFMLSVGYEIDEKRSSKRLPVLNRPSQCRNLLVPIAPNSEGFYHFYSFTDDTSGDIINLLRDYEGWSWEQIRVFFRGYSIPSPERGVDMLAERDKLGVTEGERKRAVISPWRRFKCALPNYLTKRGISSEVVSKYWCGSFPFKSNWAGAIFPCFDLGGDSPKTLTLYTVENRVGERRKSFLRGLGRGLGLLTPGKEEIGGEVLVVVESPEDALAYEDLNGKEAHYISTYGRFSKKEMLDIVAVSVKYKSVVLAFDNDETGLRYAKNLQEKIPNCSIEVPDNKDWVEDLMMEGLVVLENNVWRSEQGVYSYVSGSDLCGCIPLSC